jgi:hypothetical protein
VKIKEADDNYKATAKFFCENPSDASDKFGEKVDNKWFDKNRCINSGM